MGFPPVYGSLNENQLLRARNQEGDTDILQVPFTVTVYTFFSRKKMMSRFILTVFDDVPGTCFHKKLKNVSCEYDHVNG